MVDIQNRVSAQELSCHVQTADRDGFDPDRGLPRRKSLSTVAVEMPVLPIAAASMPPVRSAIGNAEHAPDAADGTTDAGPDRAADCAAHGPRRTMTLVRALVGAAFHAAEDALSMRLMRYGE